MKLLRYATAGQVVTLPPLLDSIDGNTKETALTPAANEVLLSKAGGSFSAKSDATAPSVDGTTASPHITLDDTDTNTLGELVIHLHTSGALYVEAVYTVVPQNVYDSFVPGTDRLAVDAQEISSSSAAADAVEANIGNLDTAISALNDLSSGQVSALLAGLNDLSSADVAALLTPIQSDIDDIMGGSGFSVGTDDLQSIRDAVDNAVTLTDVVGVLGTGVLQNLITVSDDSAQEVIRGDVKTLTLSAGSEWDFTGKKVYLCVKAVPTAANSTAIIDRECTILTATTASIALTALETAVIGDYYAEFEQRDEDGSNPKTVLQFTLSILQDVRQ